MVAIARMRRIRTTETAAAVLLLLPDGGLVGVTDGVVTMVAIVGKVRHFIKYNIQEYVFVVIPDIAYL